MTIPADRQPDGRESLDGLIAGEITHSVIGAFYQVDNTLRPGLLESVYAKAMEVEFRFRNITYLREFPILVTYRGVDVGTFRADFLVEHRVIVEIKAQRDVGEADRRQLLHYLRATNTEVGLLLNFGPEAKHIRMVNSLWRISEDPPDQPDPR